MDSQPKIGLAVNGESDTDVIPYKSIQNCRHEFVDKRVTEAAAFNDLLTQHLPSEVKNWDCDTNGWTFDLGDIVVEVRNDDVGPIIARAESNILSRTFLDSLRVDMRDIASRSFSIYWDTTEFAVLLLKLVEEAVAWLILWNQHIAQPAPRNESKYVHDTSLPAKERANCILRHGLPHEIQRLAARKKATPQAAFKAQEVAGWYSMFDNSAGLDVSSVEDTAKHLLGKSITEICKDITRPYYDPKELHLWVREDDDIRILHVEPVFRSDLVSRFLSRKDEIHQDLLDMSYQDLRKCVSQKDIRRNCREDTVEGLANALARPSVTFHGANRRNVESIVRYGFIVPGENIGTTGKALDIRCGSSYGVGIYSSPNPEYAMNYSEYQYGKIGAERSGIFKARDVPGNKLIVCATLMGRAATVTRDESRRKTSIIVDAAHSHVSPCQQEYTVFDSAQIIPCYVLHLDRHPDMRVEGPMEYYKPAASRLSATTLRAPGYKDFPEDVDSYGNVLEWKGDIERKKHAMKSGALKWFPYGFGSATATNFVIEDIADVSDDEEIYGEFQQQRIEQEQEIREQYLAPSSSWLDLYQAVRKTRSDVECSK